MTEKEKAKAYDEALERAKKLYGKGITEEIFPELNESEDERIKKAIIEFFESEDDNTTYSLVRKKDIIDWLERQGKKSSWKPSKEEMDALYSLSYITNEYDEHKEDVITHLYQDLKREFFNDSSYENMFSLDNKEDDVRRRSTIQVLEYVRSLDAYNQYGKADIDKNIAWLERQGKNSTDKTKPSFKVGDWIITPKNKVLQITSIDDTSYCDEQCRFWTLEDGKDGDVLATSAGAFIYNDNNGGGSCPGSYCGINTLGNFQMGVEHHWTGKKVYPATKEQRDLLFQKIKEAGYEWDEENKELKKLEKSSFHEGDWVVRGNTIAQILDVQEQYYIGLDTNGKVFVSSRFLNSDKIHLWTIEDAKDGDVLVHSSFMFGDFIFIYNNTSILQAYCYYSNERNRFIIEDRGHHCPWNMQEVTPATKEQRDTLMKAMNDAGYEWDTEKKELKRENVI